jgi:hypothetical protein
LSNSVKSIMSRIWRAHGLPAARNIPYSNMDELRAIAHQVPFPAFVRSDWLHGQQGMRLVRNQEELASLDPRKIPVPGCLSPFVDTRAGFRDQDPSSEFAKFFHKKRVWVMGDQVRASHLFFSASPLVSSVHGTFGHYRSINPIRRLRGRLACREHVRLDREFFYRGEPHADLLLRATRALDLEFAAIDYSSFADGRIILWDVNPHFALELWPFDVLARQRRVHERHRACHDVLHEFLTTLLAE